MTAPRGPSSGHIVVGVDGSEPSRSALRWAARLSSALGSPIDAVLAWEMPASYGLAYLPDSWRPDIDAQTELDQTIESVFGSDRPEGLTLCVDQGNPVEALVKRSDGAEMMVVGSRGHGGFTGLLLGSVSASCAEHARCSVLVVHGDPSPTAT